MKDNTEIRFVSHLSLANESVTTYASDDGVMVFCDHTSIKKNGKHGKTYRHWRLYDKVFTNYEEWSKAVSEYLDRKEEE